MEKRLANAINQKLVRLARQDKLKLPPGLSSSSLWQLRSIRDKALTLDEIHKDSDTSKNKVVTLIRLNLATFDTYVSHDHGKPAYIATEAGRELLAKLDELGIWDTPLPGPYRSDKKERKPPTRLGIEHRI